MQGVRSLQRLLSAERDGLFELHRIAVCETVPWCRAADRGNYVRYLPGYMNDMLTLQQKQPKFYQYLRDCGFVVRLCSRRFNAVATDQSLEQTIQREGRARGCHRVHLAAGRSNPLDGDYTHHCTLRNAETLKEMCQNSKQTTAKKPR